MLFLVSLGFLTGSTFLHFYSVWPISVSAMVSCVCAIVVSLLLRVSQFSLYRNMGLFLLFCSIGWGWSYYQVSRKLAERHTLDEISPVYVRGHIIGIIQQKNKNAIQFDIQPFSHSKWKIRVLWKSPTVILREGDALCAKIKMKQPWDYANPGGFSQEKQFFIENIYAYGQLTTLLEHIPSQRSSLSYFRQHISAKIEQALGEGPLVGVIQAMTVGMRSKITTEEWTVFQSTGTSHVVAISGLHIGLIAMLCSGITLFVVRRSYRLTSILPAHYWACMTGMGGAIIYSALAGFSIPTQRACIMIMVASLAFIFKKNLLSFHTLALAALLIMIVDPFAPLQIGFWLSFGCVFALVWGKAHYQNEKFLKKWFLPQWVVFIGLIPLGALFFHQISLVSPLANLIFIPIISFIIVPFSLLGAIGVPFCLKFAHMALSFSWIPLKQLASLSHSVMPFTQISTLALICCVWGALFWLLPKGIPARQLGWFGFLPLFFAPINHPLYGSFQFTLLDAGQGLAAVIQTRHHCLLYDAGPAFGEGNDAGRQIILPFLKCFGIKKLNKIIISHTDLDHRGGLNTLHRFPYDELISSEPERLPFVARKCLSNESWEWDGVRFQFLNPIHEHKKRNNVSCVLKVSANGKSVLLTGDIEELAEKEMLKRFRSELKSDVLVVPHHGSMTSSSPSFIEAVSPKYALYPVGKENHYHFPREDIVKRYQRKKSENLLTWQTGAIIFRFSGEEELTPPIQWRDTARHYWNK